MYAIAKLITLILKAVLCSVTFYTTLTMKTGQGHTPTDANRTFFCDNETFHLAFYEISFFFFTSFGWRFHLNPCLFISVSLKFFGTPK